MKLNSYKIQAGDIPGAADWFNIFLNLYNLQNEQYYNLSNGNISAPDNIAEQMTTVSVSTPSNYSSGGFNTISFPCTFSSVKVPQVCVVGQTVNQSGAVITSAVVVAKWAFSQPNNAITINYIAGLAASSKYTMTFLVK